jgi:hypothetical protein
VPVSCDRVRLAWLRSALVGGKLLRPGDSRAFYVTALKRTGPSTPGLELPFPCQPPRDLEDLLHDYGVGSIWPEVGGKFIERLV